MTYDCTTIAQSVINRSSFSLFYLCTVMRRLHAGNCKFCNFFFCLITIYKYDTTAVRYDFLVYSLSYVLKNYGLKAKDGELATVLTVAYHNRIVVVAMD